MGRFVLKVRDLEEGVSEQRFEIPCKWLEDQLAEIDGVGAANEGGSVDLMATRRGREVLLRGTIHAALKVVCVRCLEEYRLAVEADLDVLMLPDRPEQRRPSRGEDVEMGAEELGVERYRGDEIEFDDLVRDTILLEVPMNPICGDECPGWDHLRS